MKYTITIAKKKGRRLFTAEIANNETKKVTQLSLGDLPELLTWVEDTICAEQEIDH